ncbi:MAG: hypothetical protein LBE91_06615 [Tannerella sp.]|jgi:hypothetical protein|nr:hypothetical protein [Tannerella sp.]
MGKTKSSIEKIGKYFREVSVVIIGVAVTLSVSYWITKKNEKKDMALYLNSVKMELETNAANLDYYTMWLQKSVNYAAYLKSNNYTSLNKDSLDYYLFTDSEGCGYQMINSMSSRMIFTNSFEMFKVSGVMRQVADKELLSFIWTAYSQIEFIKQFLDENFQIKKQEAMKEQELTAHGKSIAVPMRIYYSTDLPIILVQQCEEISGNIKKTISKMEASKLLK